MFFCLFVCLFCFVFLQRLSLQLTFVVLVMFYLKLTRKVFRSFVLASLLWYILLAGVQIVINS